MKMVASQYIYQYFMVSNGAQLILKECEARGCNLYDLPDYAVIQINDTSDDDHPRADPFINCAGTFCG